MCGCAVGQQHRHDGWRQPAGCRWQRQDRQAGELAGDRRGCRSQGGPLVLGFAAIARVCLLQTGSHSSTLCRGCEPAPKQHSPCSASLYLATASAALPALTAALPAKRSLSAASSPSSRPFTFSQLGSPTIAASCSARRVSCRAAPLVLAPALAGAGKKALPAAAAAAPPPEPLALACCACCASSAASSACSCPLSPPRASPSCHEHCAWTHSRQGARFCACRRGAGSRAARVDWRAAHLCSEPVVQVSKSATS